MITAKWWLIVASALFLYPTTGDAADSGTDATPTATVASKPATTPDIFKFDYGVPTSPGLSLAGISPDKATTSTALKPFVLSLPYFAGGPADSQAIAFDAAPAQLYFSGKSYEAYTGLQSWERMLVRSRIDAMAFRGVSSTDPKKAVPSKLGVGYSVSILDTNDPMTARSRFDAGAPKFLWSDCVTRRMNAEWAVIDKHVPEPPDPRPLFDGQAHSLIKLLGDAPDRAAQMKILVDNHAEIATLLDYVDSMPATAAPTGKPSDFEAYLQARQSIIDARNAAQKLGPAKQATVDHLLEQAQAALDTPDHVSSTLGDPDAIVAMLKAHIGALDSDADKASTDSSTSFEAQLKADGYTSAVQTCADYANAWARLAPALDFGVGEIWAGDNGKLRGFHRGGQALWVGARLPVFATGIVKKEGDFSDPTKAWVFSLGGSARFGWRESVATGDMTTPQFDANTRDLWAGAQLLGPVANLGFQYGWYRASARDSLLGQFSQSGHEWLVSGAVQMGKNSGTWLNLSYGRAAGNVTLRDDKTLLITLSFSPPKSQDRFTDSGDAAAKSDK